MSLVTVQRNKQQQQSHDRIGRYAAANIGHAKPRPKNQLQDLGTYRRPLFAAGMIVLLVREQTNGKIKSNQPRTLVPELSRQR